MSTLSNTWITIDKNRMGGAACIRGTRITVTNVLDILVSGDPLSEVFLDYPGLDKTKILAAIDYANTELKKRNIKWK